MQGSEIPNGGAGLKSSNVSANSTPNRHKLVIGQDLASQALSLICWNGLVLKLAGLEHHLHPDRYLSAACTELAASVCRVLKHHKLAQAHGGDL